MSLNSSTYATRISILYLSLSLFYLPIFLEAYYDPVDLFSINCGSTGTSSDRDRTWIGDIKSKLLSLQHSQTFTAQAKTLAPSVNQVPYATARLSLSEFNYSFPVTAGQKFVRLFFYPASYPGFDRTNAFFTVKSGEFTLLKDFNASQNVDDSERDTIFKEYIINVGDDQRINLTFTPSTSHPYSYAFINGIEVVSMPNDLYYPADQEIIFVGHIGTPFSIDSSGALETAYRIKVGGQPISPKNDTGMLRLWEEDDAYLRSPFARLSLPGDISGEMNITVNPDYVAPKQVYRTSRDMGRNGDLNKVSNLTWEFPVDTGFTYMLRLHFCELDPNISFPGDRSFFIYIAGQIADDRADVLMWSKQKGVAVHRDYVVMIQQGSQKKVNLSLQMHPHPDSQTAYSDPFVNGLEIFKINDNSLAGPNPDPITHQIPLTRNSVESSERRTTIIISVVAAVTVFSIVAFSVIHFFLLRQHKSKTNNAKVTSKKSPFSLTKSANTQITQLPYDLCNHLSLSEMVAATDDFDELQESAETAQGDHIHHICATEVDESICREDRRHI